MLNARITNSAPASRMGSGSVNVKVRSSGFRTNEQIVNVAGSPIGLLLALTYAEDVREPTFFFSDDRPHSRIKSN